MIYEINSKLMTVKINGLGAEPVSIFHKGRQKDYLWQGREGVCKVQAPVLFPVVGGLLGDTYYYANEKYQMPKHGFAKEMMFDCAVQKKDEISFVLRDNQTTYGMYPFRFMLEITYKLNDTLLTASYTVTNTGNDTMLYSIGAHPGFTMPLSDGKAFSDYSLTFDTEMEKVLFVKNDQGVFYDEWVTMPGVRKNKIELSDAMSIRGAQAMRLPDITSVTLSSSGTDEGIEMGFADYEFLAIYTKQLNETYTEHQFICLEPWNGIGDFGHSKGVLEEKEGIRYLEPHKCEAFTFSIKIL